LTRRRCAAEPWLQAKKGVRWWSAPALRNASSAVLTGFDGSGPMTIVGVADDVRIAPAWRAARIDPAVALRGE
jgi:hypothetical protein